MSLVRALKSPEIAVLVTVFSIVMVLSSYYVNVAPIPYLGNTVLDLALIVFAFALCLGFVETIIRKIKTSMNQKKTPQERFNAIWTIGCAVTVFIFGLMSPLGSHPYFAEMIRFSGNMEIGYTTLLSFFIITASIRAFRVKNIEAFVMMITAVIMTLQFAPIGPALFPQLSPLGDWILNVPSNAVSRAVLMGIAVGTLVMIVRVVTGREKGYLGRAKQ